jgi:hypothetical protein
MADMIRHFGLLLLFLAMPLTAAEAGKAEGTLTVGGKSHKLTHAWAIAGQTTDGEPFYYVWLTDVALTDKQLGVMPDLFTKEIKEGKIHAIQIRIDKNRALHDLDVYEGDNYPTIKDPAKLDLKTFDGKTIAGRLHLDKPYRDMSLETYQFDVKFSAPIRPETDFLP